MQNYPTGWAEALNTLYRMETKVSIAGVEYNESEIVSVSTRAALFANDTISIGGCVAKEIDLVVVPKGEIPRMAEIKVFVRPVMDGIETAWLQKGVYYIDTRKEDLVYGTLTIHGYDAMLKAEQVYFAESNTELWPLPMRSVAESIAARMGVSIDARTVVSDAFEVVYPGDYTMREILGYIAAAHAGNWIISDTGDLRLVPLFSQDEELLDVGVNATSLTASPPLPAFSGVLLKINDEMSVTAGDATSRVLEADCPWATQEMADSVLAAIAGRVYQPYEAQGAILAAVAELGDPVMVGGVQSIVGYSYTIFDAMSLSDIGAPADEEVDHEYPYVSHQNREIDRRFEKVTTETLEKLDHDEIFARLTKDGTLQGLYKDKDGNIYINATYIKAGIIKALDGKSVVIDLENGTAFLTGSVQTEREEWNGVNRESTLTPSGVHGKVAESTNDTGLFSVGLDGYSILEYSALDGVRPAYCFYGLNRFLIRSFGEKTEIDGTTDETTAELRFRCAGNGTRGLWVGSDADGNYVSGLTEPTDASDAANKAYVDAIKAALEEQINAIKAQL